MAAKVPNIEPHRDYDGSVEQINGLPAADDQTLTAQEVMDEIVASLVNHAPLIDALKSDGYLQWAEGFEGRYTWVFDNSGTPGAYHATASATDEQLATVVPGTDNTVWVAGNGVPDPSSMTFGYATKPVATDVYSDPTSMGFR